MLSRILHHSFITFLAIKGDECHHGPYKSNFFLFNDFVYFLFIFLEFLETTIGKILPACSEGLDNSGVVICEGDSSDFDPVFLFLILENCLKVLDMFLNFKSQILFE